MSQLVTDPGSGIALRWVGKAQTELHQRSDYREQLGKAVAYDRMSQVGLQPKFSARKSGEMEECKGGDGAGSVDGACVSIGILL